MTGRRTRGPKSDQHGNTDRWLLTYADLITLLLGLFVILYSMSKVDSDRYSQVAQALGGMFGNTIGITASSLPQENTAPDRMDIETKLRGALYDDIQSKMVSVSQDERGVIVHFGEELLFASGSATLKSTAHSSLDLLASVLRTVPNAIRIEGHTDDVPIETASFPSNWHLSVARAFSTGEYLTLRHGLDPDKAAMIGYGEHKPVVPNTSAENRAKNRRVDIIVFAPKAPLFTQQ